PDDPPGVRPCCHGLCVTPLSTVRVQLMPPNSDDVVNPTRTAPPSASIRPALVDVCSATRSRNTAQASVYGQPVTASSSLTPIGTPPNGSDTSAAAAAANARSGSRNENALRSLASIAASVACNSSVGE